MSILRHVIHGYGIFMGPSLMIIKCLDHVLSKYNFGEKFREWVQMLFKYAQTCIKTNGFVSKYFNISRSCRQGVQ
jgi:hypothetical protein